MYQNFNSSQATWVKPSDNLHSGSGMNSADSLASTIHNRTKVSEVKMNETLSLAIGLESKHKSSVKQYN